MIDHYDTLGVPRTASPSQVKQAYRRQRGAVHPDRQNGDATAAVKLNVAYEVLIDPNRRLNYDKTGRDQLTDIDRAASDWLIREMTCWLGDPNTAGDMVGALRFKLATELSNIRNADLVQAQVLGRFQAKLSRLRLKSGKDWARPLLDAQMLAAHHQRGKGQEQMVILNRAMELLANYEFR